MSMIFDGHGFSNRSAALSSAMTSTATVLSGLQSFTKAKSPLFSRKQEFGSFAETKWRLCLGLKMSLLRFAFCLSDTLFEICAIGL